MIIVIVLFLLATIDLLFDLFLLRSIFILFIIAASIYFVGLILALLSAVKNHRIGDYYSSPYGKTALWMALTPLIIAAILVILFLIIVLILAIF